MRFHILYDDDADEWTVVDSNQYDRVVGSDGGDPEDQSLLRQWRWVVDALNDMETERIQSRNNALEAAAELVGPFRPDYGVAAIRALKSRR